ncbi:hypothetical protein D6R50_11050 [Aeromonas veronii]|uniref:Uncharacterized protein n=1 Tax=Aeromonas veronii TaxID=654 RepID=A0A3A9IYE8_AERVE|nr:hypothetical protein [Aeromonas veronii]RKJ89766.1 hypothetical protein D6R50_11050 [Aeromonas veronii]
MSPNREQVKQAEGAVITTLSALRTLAELTNIDFGEEVDKGDLVIGISALLDITTQYLEREALRNLDVVPHAQFVPNLAVVERGDE